MLDLNSERSIYIQIAEIVENQILTKSLNPEDQVPSTNEFAKVYEINPATARKGLNILVDEGVIFKKRGLGMFVERDAREKILKKRQDIFLKEKLPEILREADRLEIDRKELIEYIRRGGV